MTNLIGVYSFGFFIFGFFGSLICGFSKFKVHSAFPSRIKYKFFSISPCFIIIVPSIISFSSITPIIFFISSGSRESNKQFLNKYAFMKFSSSGFFFVYFNLISFFFSFIFSFSLSLSLSLLSFGSFIIPLPFTSAQTAFLFLSPTLILFFASSSNSKSISSSSSSLSISFEGRGIFFPFSFCSFGS